MKHMRYLCLSYMTALCLVVGFCGSARATEVTGTVVRQSDLAPIAGAKVTLQASLAHTFTAGDGTFFLSVPAGPGKVVVGAAKGYFNKGATVTSPASGVQIVLQPVPQDNNPSYALVAPETCGSCHPNQLAQWTGSPMARAGQNTWVHDIYNGMGTAGGMGGFVYTRDSVFAPTNPNSECASCHQPESWIPTPFSRMQGPQDAGYPSIATVHGVSCDTCHKVADVDVSKINFPGIFPGAVIFTRPNGSPAQQVQYGLLGDTMVNQTFMMRASYQPQLMAEVCGACHQDRSDPDENHTYTGPISEPTYIEWADSAYSDPQSPYYANCVTCHMPSTGDTEFCTTQSPPLIRDPILIRSHDIRGTTADYLENAVTMTMQTNVVGSTLNVDVTINNNLTGHHVPTGVTTRNMILLVEAWPEGGDPIADLLPSTGSQTVHALGGTGNPAQGYYSGRPGKLYAKVPHDAGNNFPAFFTDATGNIFDNRIVALQSDATSYSFTLPNTNGDVRVRARLIYRRAWRALVDAKQWTQDGHGNPLGDVQSPHYGHLMELADVSIPRCAAPGDGDVNGDVVVNALDISAFVSVYLNQPNGPATSSFCAANIQHDLAIDMNDIDLFVTGLLGL
ncbi:MAG: multiheme c-type cytochrome [Planctomycetota bacterium]